MNSLELRKQLLIAESELNRAQLAQELDAMTVSVRALTNRLKTYGSLASSAAVLAAGLAAFRRGKSASADVKPSWFQSVLKGAQMAGSLWLAFRARPR